MAPSGLGLLLFIAAYIEPKRWEIMRDVEKLQGEIQEFQSLARTLEQEVTALAQNPAFDQVQAIRKQAIALRLQVIR